MEGSVGYILAFAAGALVGGLCTYKIASDKAEERADMEIESMRKYFLERANSAVKNQQEVAVEKSKKSQNKPAVADLAATKVNTQTINYTMYSEEQPKDVVVTQEPVIISEDEFGEDEDYTKVFLTYYSDLFLAEDTSNYVLKPDEIDRSVGRKALAELEEKDIVCVRNDRTKTYYQVQNDEREYEEAVGWEADDD